MVRRVWELFKELLGDVYAISAMGWVLAHLILIKLQGIVQIYEPNPWILWFEIAGASGALMLLTERLIKDIKSRR